MAITKRTRRGSDERTRRGSDERTRRDSDERTRGDSDEHTRRESDERRRSPRKRKASATPTSANKRPTLSGKQNSSQKKRKKRGTKKVTKKVTKHTQDDEKNDAALNKALAETAKDQAHQALLKERDHEMVARLHSYFLSIIESRGDGSCFFDSVSKELLLGNSDQVEAIKTNRFLLREKVVDWMRNNQEHWALFLVPDIDVPDIEDKTPEDRLKRMSKPKEMAEDIEIIAMASMLRREIHIYSWNYYKQDPKQPFLIRKPEWSKTTGPPILLFYRDQIHYDLLRIAGNNRDVFEYEKELTHKLSLIDKEITDPISEGPKKPEECDNVATTAAAKTTEEEAALSSSVSENILNNVDENLKNQGGVNDKETVPSTTDKSEVPSLFDEDHNHVNVERDDEHEEGTIRDVDNPSNNRLANQAESNDREGDKIDDNVTEKDDNNPEAISRSGDKETLPSSGDGQAEKGSSQSLCAARDLCTMRDSPLNNPAQHHCMNCGEPMHGGLCGVLWSERSETINITCGKLSSIAAIYGYALFVSNIICIHCFTSYPRFVDRRREKTMGVPICINVFQLFEESTIE